MIAGNQQCQCRNSFYSLSSDNKTCVDVNECLSNPCSGNATCENLDGSGFRCNCLNGYKLSADGRSCVDRDGGYSAWGEWSNCTASCGGGTKTRSRMCDNPTKQGNGMDCVGAANESMACNTDYCPQSEAETNNGVILNMKGLTVAEFAGVRSQILTKIAEAVNTFCNNNTNFATCCPNYGTRRNLNATLTFTTSSYIGIGGGYPRWNTENNGTDLLLVIKAPKTNALCADGTQYNNGTGTTGRRKRAVVILSTEMALGQAVVLSLIQSTTTVNTIVTVLQAAYPNKTFTIVVAASPIPTTTTPTTTTTQVAPAPAQGVEAWVIAVSVVGALILIILIVVIILLIVKRPSKVAAGSSQDVQRSINAGEA